MPTFWSNLKFLRVGFCLFVVLFLTALVGFYQYGIPYYFGEGYGQGIRARDQVEMRRLSYLGTSPTADNVLGLRAQFDAKVVVVSEGELKVEATVTYSDPMTLKMSEKVLAQTVKADAETKILRRGFVPKEQMDKVLKEAGVSKPEDLYIPLSPYTEETIALSDIKAGDMVNVFVRRTDDMTAESLTAAEIVVVTEILKK